MSVFYVCVCLLVLAISSNLLVAMRGVILFFNKNNYRYTLIRIISIK